MRRVRRVIEGLQFAWMALEMQFNARRELYDEPVPHIPDVRKQRELARDKAVTR